jgi:hypothetical protein
MSKRFRDGGTEGGSRGRGEGEGALPQPGKGTDGLNGPTTSGAQPMSTGAVKLKVENDQKSPSGSNTRTKVGLGERIFITPEPVVSGKFSSPVGKGKDEGTLYTWDAPETAQKKVTITFTPDGGGTASTVDIEVIAPEKVEFQDKQELSYGNVSAAGMKVKVVFLPLSVSFAHLDWQEKDVDPSVADGWFKTLDAASIKHIKGPGGFLDSKNAAKDKAEWKSSVVVKEQSTLQWDIPQTYNVDGGKEQDVPNQPFTQLMTISPDGTTTVSKNGQTVTRAVPGKKK